jgi:non-specific serine/threonine protein kinase/serine/threonine-protein kinase
VLSNAWYSFAAAAATAGHHDEAFEYLSHAIDDGYGAPDAIAADPDLKSLRGDPRFDALVAKARKTVNAQPH